ncbi:hypothetical protein L292_2092 [Acinetobacter junii CIP 107470 = MTCC 11364]|uniref:Uncharacterized protein n=1 Tax=Acinetobacter junii CIP 107470 = MTCC 11364 TaxID=1217666 RepID=S7YFQ8_ACIJU|nr:hypothetical protein [Acinetobacter junii]ENV52082.1 hypothetical protein F953_00494 [Acinetobacter junii CIP 107470 = MTCC 11364]EPR86858.1 hypothetical protein L292_2092 [Acinetobacter junii CIP 107470 = MTCC 11364]
MQFDQLEAIPAFYADIEGTKVPYIVTVTFVNTDKKIVFTRAVEQSINNVCDITGKEGLITAKVQTEDDLDKVNQWICKGRDIPGIVLFHCWSGELAEQVMEKISSTFEVSLIQR